jgi:PAS domain-containing protein
MASLEETNKKYILYLRSILSLWLILAGLYNYNAVVEKPLIPLIYVALLVLSNFIFMMIPKKAFAGVKMHYIVFLADMAFITSGAALFTGLDSRFIMVIFLAVFISAIGQSVSLSFFSAVVVNVVYVFYSLGSSAEGVISEQVLLNLPFIFIVSLHSSYIAEKANADAAARRMLIKQNELLSKRVTSRAKQMIDMLEFMEEFGDAFRDAVIVLDVDGNVKLFNLAAEKILGIQKGKAINAAVKDLAPLAGARDLVMSLKFENKEAYDTVIAAGKEGKSCLAAVNHIKNRDGENVGMLLRLREIK